MAGPENSLHREKVYHLVLLCAMDETWRDRIWCVFFSSRAVPGGMGDWGRRQQPTPPALLEKLRWFEFFATVSTMQRIRTEGEMPFEPALTELSQVPVYQAIAEQAAHLHLLGMNPNHIVVHLGVDRTTATKALRCIRFGL